MKQPTVYLLASQRNGTLYVGVTSDLIKRVWQHRTHAVDGFTKKYNVNLLMWFEQHETMESAIAREKAIKKWNRPWKLALIEKTNPNWIDLWPVITGEILDSRLRGNDARGGGVSFSCYERYMGSGVDGCNIRTLRVCPIPHAALFMKAGVHALAVVPVPRRHSRAGGNPVPARRGKP